MDVQQAVAHPVIAAAMATVQSGNAPTGLAVMLAELIYSFGVPDSATGAQALTGKPLRLASNLALPT